MDSNDSLCIALAQIAPVWLNKEATINKILNAVQQASDQKAGLVVFGEGILPGYPYWLGLCNGAEFDSRLNKEIHAHYMHNAITIERSELKTICDLARKLHISIYLGIIERPLDRGGHSLYCSLVYIDQNGIIQSIHRKLQPTYDERLTWAQGDGHGLKVHQLKNFVLGGLNCWENWMPLARTTLYGLGENVHIAVWPGSKRNTEDISRFIAKESRSFVVSVSGLMRMEDIPKETPHYEQLILPGLEVLADGGSCVAGPDGQWILEPVVNQEAVFTVQLELDQVFRERQNFDPSGHYSRPDVFQLHVDKKRQQLVHFKPE